MQDLRNLAAGHSARPLRRAASKLTGSRYDPEAIRKMSLMPAQTIEDFVPQMRRKGRLQVGMDADIVVFDPKTVADRATYDAPNQPAIGVQTVLVNGGFVVRDGELVLDAPHGQPIRRAVSG